MAYQMEPVIDFIKGFNLQNILTLGGMIWLFAKYIRHEIKSLELRIDRQEERLFLLATGKTLREAMVESKRNQEEKK